MTGKHIAYLVNLGLLLMGIIFLSIAIGINSDSKKKIQRCKCMTKAIVVGMERERTNSYTDDTGTYSWFPTYEYTVNEQTIRRKSHMGQAKQIFKDGQEVELYYNPKDCNEFYVPQENVQIMVVIFGAVGCTLLAAAVMMFAVLRKINM